MDRAPAVPEGDPDGRATGRPPAIGVPSIPAQNEPRATPAPVPSAPVPGEGTAESTVSEVPSVPPETAPDAAVHATTTGADAPDVGADQAAGVSHRARPTVPVVSTRSMPLPAGRRSPDPSDDAPPSDRAHPDAGPARSRDPFDMAFPPGVAARLEWYVYLVTDPGSGRPFYVGRGRGDRCFRHVLAARAGGGPDLRTDVGTGGIDAGPDTGPGGVRTEGASAESGPDGTHTSVDDHDGSSDRFPMVERIREVEAREGPVQLEILRYGLSSDQARLVQAAAADVLGLQQDLKQAGRRRPASELGARLAKRAKFKSDHRVVLLRVGDQGADTSYETVRHDWRIGRRWIDPRSSRSPRWAVIVVGELIVAVYRIDRWEPTPLPGPPGPSGRAGAATFTARSTYRHSFVGAVDPVLEGRYVGRSVAAYLGAGSGRGPGMVRAGGVGAQNQVTYVWCGPHWVNPAG